MDQTRPEFILDRIEVDHHTGCWEWTRSRNPKTMYGQIGTAPYTAHRLSYSIFKGQPAGVVRHRCHNRGCCNPEHLVDGTHADNYNDSRDIHTAAARRRRGRASANRKPVTINGVTYPSQVHAMRDLSVTYSTLTKLAG